MTDLASGPSDDRSVDPDGGGEYRQHVSADVAPELFDDDLVKR